MNPALVAVGLGIAMMIVWLLVWWSEGASVVRARDLLASGATLIDVDPPAEFESDHPEGARSVPFAELPRMAPDLGSHDHPIVVYAHEAWRATFAAWRLRAIGFHEVVSLGKARP